ncbi:MAG: hypothetical protein H6850_03095 [Alphaproteobacteria bacterium]|nr:MAG: hypothetical protein H6850_03095 [Alphaproteobacteria bacterium]
MTTLGIIIHILGILDFINKTTIEMDCIMLMIDVLIVYGLVQRKNWGYYLALGLYLQQSIMQPYWAYQSDGFILHSIEWFIAPVLVITCFFILLFRKNNFS